MKKELVFQERQYFQKWKAAILFVLINAPLLIGCVIQIKPWGNHPMNNAAFLILTIVLFLFGLVFFFVRLDTVIDREGVYVQMFPLQWRFKFTPWDCIRKAGVRKTNPFLEGGGWLPAYQHSRYMFKLGAGFQRHSLLAIISGNKVLQLELINNKKIIIGTQRPEELLEFLDKLDAERKQK